MANEFDRVIHENFEKLSVSVVHKILGINPSRIAALPRKVQRTMEREMDWLFKVTEAESGDYLLNVEWQMTNDPHMCERMLLYNASARIKYGLRVLGFGFCHLCRYGETQYADSNK